MHSSLTEANVVPLQFREAIYYLLCCYRWRTVHQCLGHTLLEVGNIFCFLKSKVLIKFPFQRLSLYDPFPPSLSSQHSTDLLTRVIHFLQARAIISKPQFQPFFFTVFTEESLGQVFQNGIAEKVSKGGRTAACNQGVMLVERRECRKILPPP